VVASGADRTAKQWREIDRSSRHQRAGRQHPAGNAGEGPHLQRGAAAIGELKGELGRDGLPTYFRGKITAGAGNIIDSDTPDYPMAIDAAEMNVEWDSARRVLVAPFKIISGANRITLLAISSRRTATSPTGRRI